MSNIYRGRDPFDDPFFTRPFGSLFGSAMFGSGGSFDDPPPHVDSSKGPVIEELDSDAEQEAEEEGDVSGVGGQNDKYNKNAWANNNPHVEHPEDQPDDHCKGKSKSKEVSCRTDHSKAERTQPQLRSVSFQRVTYGGINGTYYTATSTRKTGSDGVVLEESKQADKTTGEATHRISRGIHDKGHSLTRKLKSDGKVDATHTLHNLHEDELATFEQAWKGNASRHLPGWDNGFDLFQNSGTGDSGRNDLRNRGGWALPFRGFGSFSGRGLDRDAQAHSSGGRPKKVVTINIE